MGARIASAAISTTGTTVQVLVVDDAGKPAPVTALQLDNVQQVTITGDTGFTRWFFGGYFAQFPVGVDADQVQAELETFPAIGAGNVAVAGDNPYNVWFRKQRGNFHHAPIQVDAANVHPANRAGVSVTTLIHGGLPSVRVNGAAPIKVKKGTFDGTGEQGIVVFTLPAPVTADDHVTISVGEGVILTAQGPVPITLDVTCGHAA